MIIQQRPMGMSKNPPIHDAGTTIPGPRVVDLHPTGSGLGEFACVRSPVVTLWHSKIAIE